MTWPLSILVAFLTGFLACIAAGIVASLCADWYHVSHMEGGAGLFVLAFALLGGIAGTIIGLIVSRIVASGFLRSLGVASGTVLGIAGIVLLLSWALADIPPRIGGRYLDLEVELRLPAGAAQPVAQSPGDTHLILGSVNPWNHVQRASWTGDLDVANAHLVDGRWVIPGKVYVFTTRGDRSISPIIDGKSLTGFIVPLPARPGSRDEQWSDWLPRSRGGSEPWPDTEPSYRYRVQRIIPPPPPPDPAVVEAERFAALKPEAPLDEWLSFLSDRAPPERTQAVLRTVESRPADLAAALRSTDPAQVERALGGVQKIETIAPEVTDAMRELARGIAEGIRSFNTMKPEDPRFYEIASDLRNRFSVWRHAWWSVHQRTGIDGRPPIREILELARVRNDGTCMQEIELDARVHLEALDPAAVKKP